MKRNPLFYAGDPEDWEGRENDPILGEGRELWETCHEGLIPDTLGEVWETARPILVEYFEFCFAAEGELGENVDHWSTLDARLVALLMKSGICPAGRRRCLDVTVTRREECPAPLTERTVYWFLLVFEAVYCDTRQRFADILSLGAAYWELVVAAESDLMKRGHKALADSRKAAMLSLSTRRHPGDEMANKCRQRILKGEKRSGVWEVVGKEYSKDPKTVRAATYDRYPDLKGRPGRPKRK